MSPERSTVLVVEDDEDVANLLESWGDDGYFKVVGGNGLCYRVSVFPDLPEASSFLQKNLGGIVGVWTDFELRCCSGLDFAREVKRLSPTMPVVMVSGSEYKIKMEVAKKSGVDLFVPKPVDLDSVPLISQSFGKIRRFYEGDRSMVEDLSLLLAKNRRFGMRLLLS